MCFGDQVATLVGIIRTGNLCPQLAEVAGYRMGERESFLDRDGETMEQILGSEHIRS